MIWIRVLLVAAAVGAALVPLPPRLVEAWYSRGVYPAIQAFVTPFSNQVPFALLDGAALVLIAGLGFGFWRRARTAGLLPAITSSGVRVVTVTAVLFLLFLATWGLNYRRVPLHEQLDYDQGRITREAAIRLGGFAVAEVNALHTSAHGEDGLGPGLESAFGAAQRILGNARLAVPGVPKRSLLERYFRAAAIDGMTDPFFLEVILNPDALSFERPFVLAHEWAHLAGYANEAEANFVAWLVCTQGDAMARYSGWLAIFEHVAASLPRADRALLTSQLGAGPRHDLQRAAARYATASPVVRTAARDVYDTYLRANRVHEGVASYTAVVRLMLGAGLEDGRGPKLR
jgi:hypothetical protein